MADGSEGIRNLRKAIRSQISKQCSSVEEVFKRVVLNEKDISDLATKKRLLLESKHRLYGLQQSPLSLADPADIEAEMDKDYTYDSKIEEMVTKIDDELSKHQRARNYYSTMSSLTGSASPAHASTSSSADGSTDPPQLNPTVTFVNPLPHPALFKLPTLEIPVFKGDITAWANFWTRFDGAVSRYTTIRDSDKLQMLISSLKGPPLDLVRDFEINDDNYQLALQVLNDEYGSVRNLRNKHLEELMHLKPVESSKNLAAIRLIEVAASKHAQALLKLEVEESLIYDVIIELFPMKFVRQFYDNEDHQSVSELLNSVKRELRLREKRAKTDSRRGNRTRSKSPDQRAKHSKPEMENVSTASMLLSTTEKKTNEAYCLFCDVRTHWGRRCMAKLSLKRKHEILASKSRCLSCMKTGHVEEECTFPFRVCERCGGKHFVVVCPRHPYANYLDNKQEVISSLTSLQIESTSDEDSSEGSDSVSVNVVSESKRGLTLMQTAEVSISKGKRKVNVICLLDSGSQKSFLQQEVITALDLQPAEYETLVIEGFATKSESGQYPQYKIKIKGLATAKSTKLNVIGVPQLTNYTSKAMTDNMKVIWEKMNHLGLTPADSRDRKKAREVRLIIGADFLNNVQLGKIVKINDDLTAHETIFGWTVQGRMSVKQKVKSVEKVSGLFATAREITMQKLNQQLQRFWELDVVGIKEETKSDSVDFDKRFRDNLIFNGQRYIAQLPWLDEKKISLQNNRDQTLRRFQNTIKRVINNPQLLDQYDSAMTTYESEGHAAVVNENVTVPGPIYYMPHHAVICPERSTKVRVVFDASSHDSQQLSLNDCLFGGTDMSIDLVKILLQFRSGKFACTTDLKKAFLQIQLSTEDQDALRYFWVDKSRPKSEWANYPRTLKMTRVTFGVISSPYMLRQTINEHCQRGQLPSDINPDSVATLTTGLYVDDIVFSKDSATSLDNSLTDISSITKSAGFDLHSPVRNDNVNESTVTSVLGIDWKLPEDTLIIKKPNLSKFSVGRITKRQLVSAATSIFDPIGLLLPLTITARVLIQDVWRAKINWDDYLPNQLNDDWKLWRQAIEKHQHWSSPRYLTPSNCSSPILNEKFELHYFADASAKAYGSVAYAKYETDTGTSESCLILAKFRVTPIKITTIPRLELMAATISARLATYLRRQFYTPTRSYFWTDSTIALHWIKNTVSKKDTFVYNRAQEINRATAGSSWNHCSGAFNPADLATRPNSVFSEERQETWLMGPDWLKSGDAPTNAPIEEMEEEDVVYSLLTSSIQPKSDIGKLIDISKFSALKRLYRVTWAVLRASLRLRKLEIHEDQIQQRIEELWIYSVQAEVYRNEQKLLENNLACHLPSISTIRNLNPFFDNSKLIRGRSRLQCSSLEYNEKCPIILPEQHPFTTLIISDVHGRLRHAGVATVLTTIRQHFWVVNGRRACRRVISSCLHCRKFNGERVTQPTAPLPQDRTDYNYPFSCVGLDYAGPVNVRSSDGKTINKSYIALFTCSTSRAVHLEAVSSMDTDHFMMALRRFVNRRGTPRVIYSDNAAQFKLAANQLQKFDCISTADNFKNPHGYSTIKWKWIAERAPWWGGFWERLVQSIKVPLRKTLGRAILTHEELETVLTEVEVIVNSRPITICTDDIEDGGAITPCHLLYGRPLILLRPSTQLKKDHVSFTQRFRTREKLMQRMAELWKKDYLLQLRSLHVTEPFKPTNIKEGQVVLLLENNEPRHKWRMCRITSTIIGRDGRIRSCWLKTPNGSLIKRPVQSLVLLEAGSNVDAPGTVA